MQHTFLGININLDFIIQSTQVMMHFDRVYLFEVGLQRQ